MLCCRGRSSEYAVAKESFDELAARQDRVLAKLQPSVLIASLATAAATADQESNVLYDQFAAKERTLDDFVMQHVKLRTLYHTRELKRQAAEQTQWC